MFKANLYLACLGLTLIGLTHDFGRLPTDPSSQEPYLTPGPPSLVPLTCPEVSGLLLTSPPDSSACQPSHLTVNDYLAPGPDHYYRHLVPYGSGYLTTGPGNLNSTDPGGYGPTLMRLEDNGLFVSGSSVEAPGGAGEIANLSPRLGSSPVTAYFGTGHRALLNGNVIPFVFSYTPQTALTDFVTPLAETSEPLFAVHQEGIAQNLRGFGHGRTGPGGARSLRTQTFDLQTGQPTGSSRFLSVGDAASYRQTEPSGGGFLSLGTRGGGRPLLLWSEAGGNTVRAGEIDFEGEPTLTGDQRLTVGDNGAALLLAANGPESRLLLVRTDLVGRPLAALRLGSGGLSLRPVDVVPHADGYLLAAATPDQTLVLLQVPTTGAVTWAYRYPGFRVAGDSWVGSLLIDGGQIIISGANDNNSRTRNATLRLPPEGFFSEDCLLAEPLLFAVETLPFTMVDLPVTITDTDPFSLHPAVSTAGYDNIFQIRDNASSCGTTCLTDTNCEELFNYRYSSVTNTNPAFTNYLDLVRTEDRIYAAGQIDGFAAVSCLNLDGTIRWSRQSNVPSSSLHRLILDEDGTLTAVGNTYGNANSPTPSPDDLLAWRLNRATGATVWASTLSLAGKEFADVIDVRQEGPGGLLHLSGYTRTGQDTKLPAVIRLRPQDGQVAGATEWTGPFAEAMLEDVVTAPDGTIYELFVYGEETPGSYAIRATGAENWTRTYRAGFAANTRQNYLLWYDNQLHVVGSPGAAVTAGMPQQLVTLRIAPTGELLSAQTATIGTGVIFGAAVSATGIQVAFLDQNLTNLVVAELDGRQRINRERAYVNLFAVPFSGQEIATYGNLVLIPHLSFLHLGTSLIQASADPDLQLPCLPQVSSMTTFRPLTVSSAPTTFAGRPLVVATQSTTVEAGTLVADQIDCRPACLAAEICDNGIDDDNDGLIDCADDDLASECCCAAAPTADLGPDATVCADTLLTVSSTVEIATYLWSDGSTNPNFAAPGPGTYHVTATDVCGRSASDTIVLSPVPTLPLDLGPDRRLCLTDLISIVAPPGFVTYNWADGVIGPTRVIAQPATYQLTTTDRCGRMRTDEVIFTSSGPTMPTEVVLDVCSGDSVLVAGAFRRLAGTYRDTLLTATGCDSVVITQLTVSLSPVSKETVTICAGDSIFLGGAQRALAGVYHDTLTASSGCDSLLETTLVILAPLSGQRELTICPGDSTFLGGAIRTGPGIYTDTLPSSVGCDSVISTTLTLSPLPVKDADLSLCRGGSIFLGGAFRTAAGVYLDTLRSTGTCDTLLRTTLTITEAITVEIDYEICGGDSLLIHGIFRSDPGRYRDTFPRSSACDSISEVLLIVNDLTAVTTLLAAACDGEDAGAGSVMASGGVPPYQFRWSDGSRDPEIAALPPATFGVTVSDDRACNVIRELTVPRDTFARPSLVIDSSSCPSAADGRLQVLDSQPGYRYGLHPDSLSNQTEWTGLAAGSYVLFGESPGQCRAALPFSITALPPWNLSILGARMIRLGDSVRLTAVTDLPPAEPLSWFTEDELLCGACPGLTVTPPRTQTFTVVGSPATCPLEATITVVVDDREIFYLPTAFSPNGDGQNDRFRLYPGPAVTEILSFAVYDRWGGQLFRAESTDPTAEAASWDGTRAGSTEVPIGVYVYAVEVRLRNGRILRRAGEVLVLR